MTEEKQGGTTPEPEAIASAADQASEDTVAAVAVADEPATSTDDAAATTESESAPAAEAAVDEPVSEPAAASASPDAATADAVTSRHRATPRATFPTPLPQLRTLTAETADAVSDAADDGLAAPAPVEASTNGQATETLSVDETADAPAAGDEEEEEAAPPRDLGPEPTTMEELLAEQDSDIKSFKHGDVVEGQVVRIDKDEILVDIGAKSEGVVSNRELFGRHGEGQPELAIGDTVLVYVLQPESPEGHVVLSLRRAGLERKWRAMQEQFEAGVIIEAPVIDHNKGGLIVDCGIRGFVPISQIVDFPRRPQNDQPRDAAQEIAEKLMPFVGRKLRLKILEVNRKANRLILSEKVALYEERREKRDELFSSLQVGQKVTGTVRSIAPFGVFIDLGGIDGLVHKSELSWNKVNNPESGYHVGEEVEAEVIDINHERGRISLSIRRLQPDPWHSTVADFKVGDIIDGTVTKLVNFGAFVRVRDGLEGLIHISELSHQRVAHPGDVVHEGQSLKLKIISLDSERHRLGLSLKQAEEPPARPVVEAGAPGAPSAPGAPARRTPAAPRAQLLAVGCGPGARGRDRQHARLGLRPGPPAAGRRRGRRGRRDRRRGRSDRGGLRGRQDRRRESPRSMRTRRSRRPSRPTRSSRSSRRSPRTKRSRRPSRPTRSSRSSKRSPRTTLPRKRPRRRRSRRSSRPSPPTRQPWRPRPRPRSPGLKTRPPPTRTNEPAAIDDAVDVVETVAILEEAEEEAAAEQIEAVIETVAEDEAIENAFAADKVEGDRRDRRRR